MATSKNGRPGSTRSSKNISASVKAKNKKSKTHSRDKDGSTKTPSNKPFNQSTKNKVKDRNRNNDQVPTFVPRKKSKKAKNKDRKNGNSNKTGEKGIDDISSDRHMKNENSFARLDNEDDDEDDIDSQDEMIMVSSASESSDDEDDAGGDDEEEGEGEEEEEEEEEEECNGDTKPDSTDNNSLAQGDKNIIFIDSDDNDSNSENISLPADSAEEDNGDDQPPRKIQKTQQSSMNDDYIAFDFSSDGEAEASSANRGSSGDEEDENTDNDDNEYLSNDEGSYHSKNIKHKAGAINDEFPWVKNSDHSKEREMADWLTSEIKDFVKYISPSVEEIKSRNALIGNLKSHIKSIWPDAELHCFGSFATDLYLPGSDIDCVVVSKRGRYDNKSSLYQLTSYIRNHGLGTEVVPIAKAKVPIIKFVDPKTRIHIDISFERSNGLTAAKLIINWLHNTPGLRELVLIVKQFLSVRKLNEVHVGGLGGFSIICLCYSFLKLHPRVSTGNIDPMENLGCLLIEFFELYGYNFGYDDVALAFTFAKEPIYISKKSNPDLLGRNPFSLAIQDPHDSSNNISRGSFNLRDIKRAFGGAFELLVNRCYELNSATYKERLGKSILGGIIKYKGKQRDFVDARHHIKNVAFHAASGKDKMAEAKKTSGVLPPLPSEKAGLNPEDFYMSDSFYSDEDSENDGDKIEKQYGDLFASSQKPKPKPNSSSNLPPKPAPKQGSKSAPQGKKSDLKTEQLLDIKASGDEDDDENYTPTVAKTTKEPDFTDSENDSDYDPAAISAASALEKDQRRDYWKQKSGKTF